MRPAGVPSPDIVVAGLRHLLRVLPVTVTGGLVYGSVAKGSHHPGSDVDALLITAGPASSAERRAIVQLYKIFVSSVGLRPDDEYPVEIFTLDECRRMVGITTGAPWPRRGDGFRCSPDDAREVVYALTTPHLVVTGEPLVRTLRRAAERQLAALADQWSAPPRDPDTGRPNPMTTR